MIDAIIIAGIFILVLIIYVSFLSTLKIKSKVEELSVKLDYIDNKLDIYILNFNQLKYIF